MKKAQVLLQIFLRTQISPDQNPFVLYTTMNDLDAQYNTYIEHCGRTYRYDPDHDAFYPTDCYRDMSVWEAVSPLVIMLVLCAIAVYLEYFR